jgi:hypothetical protein
MTAIDYIVRAQRCRQKSRDSRNPTDAQAWKELAEIYDKLAAGVGIYSRLPSQAASSRK